ncbi:MAG: HAMP domain-containing histidine kinase [Alphaproteobacteria bacterium]|nr:HAMP domain-containing histidine kinase [Alphaproteobacteria bacterium]
MLGGNCNSAKLTIAAEDEAHLVMFSPLVMVLGQSMYLATTILIYLFFRTAVPADKLQLWLWIAGLGFGLSVAFCAAFIVRRPDAQETVHFWRKIDKRLTHVFDVIAVATIFLLFPYGEIQHRMVALAFCVGYGPMQLIADPENLWANRISVVAILGAFGIQLWRMDDPAALILSILFALYGGVLIAAAGIFRNAFADVVEAKQISEQAQRHVQLALKEVSASRDAKTRFIANASHDLGQPLQAASHFVRQIKSLDLNAIDRAAVVGLEKSVLISLNMISHMLQFLRLEADSVRPNLVPVVLSAIQKAIVELHEGNIKERGVEVRLVLSSASILTDQALLLRAVDNLFGNALKHAESRRVFLGVKSAGPGRLRIWVIDQGVGIAAEEIDALFGDYVQGKSIKPGGFGLGLSSARHIAQLLGGSVGFAPLWKKGCAAYIELGRT